MGPERSGETVSIQCINSDFKQYPFSPNSVEGPVTKQYKGSVRSVYFCFHIGAKREAGSGERVSSQPRGSVKPVCKQYVRNI